jgi:hypothetical protein
MAVERKWRQARIGFDEVLECQPQNPCALLGQALLHVADAELAGASRCAREAWQGSPLADSVRMLFCWIEYLAGEFDEALELSAQFRASGSTGPAMAPVHALALSQLAPSELNIRQIESMAAEFSQNRTLQGVLGYVYGVSGHVQRASQVLKSLQNMLERQKRNYGYSLALVLMGLGRRDEAVPWLETSFDQGSIWSLGFRSDPILKPLRGNARFEALLRKIGSTPETRAINLAEFRPKSLRRTASVLSPGARFDSVGDSLDEVYDNAKSGAA